MQTAVQNGNYVTAVSKSGNIITFTFSGGSTTNIELDEDQVGSIVTVEDGVLYIDGEPTDIKAAADPTPGEEHKDQIIIENNMWSVLQEDGTYKSTGIPVSGVTVSGSEADGYTFTIYASDGTPQTVKLPSAASAITELTLGDETKQNGVFWDDKKAPVFTQNKGKFSYDTNDFLISNQVFNWKDLTGENLASSKWMGNKSIPANGSYIYSSPTSIDLRIDPVDVTAENIKFYLTNTKNENLSPVVLNAAGDPNGDGPMDADQVNGRAAVAGNGLWVLSMANQTVAGNQNTATWKAITNAGEAVFAVNANNAFRSKYELNVKAIDPQELISLKIKGEKSDNAQSGESAGVFTFGISSAIDAVNGLPYKSDYEKGAYAGGPSFGDKNTNFKTNTAYKVEAVEASALYDMYLTADESDREVYGLSFDQDKHTFTIGKNPDVSSIPAEFDLIIYTVSNKGEVEKAVVTIVLNSEISTPAEYTLINHDVNKAKDEDNFFTIDLATMKTALGDNLNQWMQNVDLTATAITYGLYADEKCETEITSVFDTNKSDATKLPLEARIVAENTKDAKETTDRNKANFIRININNNEVSTYNNNSVTANKLQLDKTYYVKVDFKATSENGAGYLNSIIVPVEFTAPALSDLFTIKEGYQSEGSEVINAYFYQIEDEVADGIKFSKTTTQVYLDRFFSAYVPMANVAFANGNVGETGHDGEWLFDLKKINADGKADATGAIKFSGEEKGTKTHLALDFDKDNKGIKDDGGVQNGYNQVVTLDVEKDYFNTVEGATNGWRYTQDGDNEYSFQIRLMSPIREGKVVPAEGTAIDIDGNDLATGASITNDMIEGRTYNNVRYSIVPDAGNRDKGEVIYESAGVKDVGADDYLDPQIQKVVPNTDDNNYLQSVQVFGSYTEKDVKVPGELKLKSSSISRDMTIQLPIIVTDAWNVVLEQEVPVSIKFNN